VAGLSKDKGKLGPRNGLAIPFLAEFADQVNSKSLILRTISLCLLGAAASPGIETGQRTEVPVMSVFAGNLYRAPSIDADATRAPEWWPRSADERRELERRLDGLGAELAERERTLRRECRARGEAPPPNLGERKLTSTDHRVFRALVWGFLNVKTGRCDPSLQALAEALNVTRKTVSASIGRLVRFGVLTRVRRRGIQRRGPVWWMGQVSNAYAFVRRAARNFASETKQSLFKKRETTAEAWNVRLRRLADVAFERERRHRDERERRVEELRAMAARYEDVAARTGATDADATVRFHKIASGEGQVESGFYPRVALGRGG
jgi:predicted transcriptional regulator